MATNLSQFLMRPSASSPWTEIQQPDEDVKYGFETTYSDDTKRSTVGTMYERPYFTVEQFGFTFSDITAAQMSEILQIVAKGKRFQLRYFSPFYGVWRTDFFYVGKGDLTIGQLDSDTGLFSSLTINCTGVNPI